MRSIFNLFAVWSAIARLAYGACEGTVHISSPEEATKIATCTTYSGHILIETPAPSIALDGIENLIGNLSVSDNHNTSDLSSSSLLTISGELLLFGAYALATISFPKLHSIGTLSLDDTPSLQKFEFDAGVNVSNLSIWSYNSIHELKLNINYADRVSLSAIGNKTFTLPLRTVGDLDVRWQSDNMLMEFPDLTWANDIDCIHCANISMPALTTVNGTYSYYQSFNLPSNSTLELPSLNAVNGELRILSNDNISEVSFPKLFTVGNLTIMENARLTSLNLGLLSTVDGFVNLTGDFSNISMPSLQNVGVNFSIFTSDASLDCNAFDAYKQSGVINGPYECNGTHSLPSASTSAFSSASATGSPPSASRDSGLSTGAKAGIGVSVPVAVLGLLGGILAVVLRRKRAAANESDYTKPEKDSKPIVPEEMASGKEAHELQAEHGSSETDANGVRVIEGTHEIGSGYGR